MGVDDLCAAGPEKGTEKSLLLMVGKYDGFPRPCNTMGYIT